MRRRFGNRKYSRPFIITVKSDNTGTSNDNQFTIPTGIGNYNYKVETSDGQLIEGLTGDTTITFPTAGTYDINISGNFPQAVFGQSIDKDKLIDVKQWGTINWSLLRFGNCNGLSRITSIDIPNLSNVSDFDSLFQDSTIERVNNIENWDTSNVVNFRSIFTRTPFNQSLNNWDVSNGTNFLFCFDSADNYNQSMSNWDISNATSMIGFMQNSDGLEFINYDATLIGWENSLQAKYPDGVGYTASININFGGSVYYSVNAANARQSLIDNFNWTITDGGQLAPFTLPTLTETILVAQSAPQTIAINDTANSANIPSNFGYGLFIITADWTQAGGGPWSSEAEIQVTTAAGVADVDPPTGGGADNSDATTLTFSSGFADIYYPSLDGSLSITLGQSFGGSSSNWSNISITLQPFIPPPLPPIEGTLNVSGCLDSDTFIIAYNASVKNIIWVEVVYDGNCSALIVDTEESTFDTEIGLYDSNGFLIGSDDDGGSGTLSLYTATGLAAGTYYVVAGRFNVTFGTAFDVTSNNTTATGTLKITARTPVI